MTERTLLNLHNLKSHKELYSRSEIPLQRLNAHAEEYKKYKTILKNTF